MAEKSDVTDMKSLFENLREDMKQDDLYWKRNDAKIRAVTSAKTYEEFKNIVDAAHLTALSKSDRDKPAQHGWNRALK